MIQEANLGDINEIYKLITSESKHLLHRTKKEIRDNLKNFVVANVGGKIVGCASFENYSPKIAEIRSVAVLPKYREQKIGTKLISALLKRVKKGQEVFVVTSKVKYFEKLGFNNCLNEKYVLFMKK